MKLHKLFIAFCLAVIAVPVMAQREEIFFFDDFEDNRNNWNVSSDDNSGRDMRNGYYYFISKKEKTTWWQYNPKVPPIDKNRDFFIEWSFIQTKGNSDWGNGI